MDYAVQVCRGRHESYKVHKERGKHDPIKIDGCLNNQTQILKKRMGINHLIKIQNH